MLPTVHHWMPRDIPQWLNCFGNIPNSAKSLSHPVSQTATGCVTCHTRHAFVTDFRPIWGNTVEVAHMTSSVMYINSHAKGTSLPLARITTMIPPFEPWDTLADPVTEGPAQWLSPSLQPVRPSSLWGSRSWHPVNSHVVITSPSIVHGLRHMYHHWNCQN